MTTIHPEKILRELSELWSGLAREEQPDQPGGVLRACAMTLIATAGEAEDLTSVGETMAALMREHPSRAIVIRLRRDGERALSSRVYAQCWMPFGQRRQICCEQIEITASEASLPDLPAVVLPLAVADLPVILWCRDAHLFGLPAFSDLARMAHKLVLDSASFPDPRRILTRLASAIGSEPILADLAWTRLTCWREWISQIFDSRGYLARLERIGRIEVRHTGATPPVSAYYMAAWLTGSSGVRDCALVSSDTEGISLIGDGVHLDVNRKGQTLEARLETLVNCRMLPEATDYALLREDLSIPGRDPIYEKTLAAAAKLA